MSRFFGVVLIVLALAMAIVPAFTDCESQGHTLSLANGKTVSMKCHWSGRAEMVLAAPLMVIGIIMTLSKNKHTRQNLSIVGGVIGILGIFIPYSLIGVCTGPTMICHSVMRPALTVFGGLVIATSSLGFIQAVRQKEYFSNAVFSGKEYSRK